MTENKIEDHWKNYEIQKPDGSWTTVGQLLQETREEVIKELWNKVDIAITIFPGDTAESVGTRVGDLFQKYISTQKQND